MSQALFGAGWMIVTNRGSLLRCADSGLKNTGSPLLILPGN